MSNLKKALQASETFVSVCAHELTTPLTSMRMLTQMGKRGKLTPEQMDHILDDMDCQLERALQLVADMSDMARISSGRITLKIEILSTRALIEGVIARLKPQIEESGSKVSMNALDMVVAGDRIRIEQVLTNLLTNALKYGNGQPIVISAEKHTASMKFIVKDSGIGISKDNLSRIFERYERVSERKFSGLGLGLYIAKEIMTAHKGKLTVESKLGSGSVFTAELPLTFGLRAKAAAGKA